MFYTGFSEWVDGPDENGDGFADYISGTNKSLMLATSTDDGESWIRDPNNPLTLTTSGVVGDIAAQVIGDRIHLWVIDDYDGQSAVGYFLYEPQVETLESTDATESAE